MTPSSAARSSGVMDDSFSDETTTAQPSSRISSRSERQKRPRSWSDMIPSCHIRATPGPNQVVLGGRAYTTWTVLTWAFPVSAGQRTALGQFPKLRTRVRFSSPALDVKAQVVRCSRLLGLRRSEGSRSPSCPNGARGTKTGRSVRSLTNSATWGIQNNAVAYQLPARWRGRPGRRRVSSTGRAASWWREPGCLVHRLFVALLRHLQLRLVSLLTLR